jgi:hypothetical protein
MARNCALADFGRMLAPGAGRPEPPLHGLRQVSARRDRGAGVRPINRRPVMMLGLTVASSRRSLPDPLPRRNHCLNDLR